MQYYISVPRSKEKRQILHTYENGIEDDDIRRSIVQRKRELDADDQERKERTRIAEEGLDRKIRERDNEFATRQDKFDRSHATFDERLREQNIRIVANTKRKIREIFGVFKKEINKFARRIQRTIEKIRVIGEKRLRELDHTEIEASLDMDEEILESPEYENNNTWRMGI